MTKKQKETTTIAVTSIKLSISGKEIEVTLDDARRLKAALDELFKEKERVTYIPYQQPVPAPTSPWKVTYGDILKGF